MPDLPKSPDIQLIVQAIDHIQDAYIQVNHNWSTTYLNASAERLFNLSKQEAISRHFPSIVSDVFKPLLAKIEESFDNNILPKDEALYFDFQAEHLWLKINAIASKAGILILIKENAESSRYERQLAIERQKCQAAFDDSPLPKWIYDLKTLKFLDVNPAATALYGYSRTEFLQMNLQDIRPAEEQAVLEAIVRKELKKNMPNQSMVIHRKKNGENLFVIVKGNAMQYQDKSARMVSIIDLTGIHSTTNALASSEQRFKLLVQDGSDLVTIFDPTGVYKFASPTSKRVLGVQPELLLGKNVFDFIHPEDRETAKLQFKLVETQERVVMPPFRYRHFNGETRWMETIITNRLKHPAIKGIITNSRDVTDRVQQEIETKKIIERFNTVSKATSDAIWDLELNTKTITWNKGLRGLFGYNMDVTSMDWWKSKVHPDDLERIIVHFSNAMKAGLTKSKLEYRYRCENGSYKTVFDRSYIRYDEKRRPSRITGSMQDITEHKRQIAEIERQNNKLREISLMQSHELRAPLASLMGLISLIDPNDRNPEDIYELLPMLIKTSKDIDNVVQAINEKAKIG